MTQSSMEPRVLLPAAPPSMAPAPLPGTEPRVFLPPDQFVGWLLDDAVDPAWCAARIAELTECGFAATSEHYPADYRNNDRRVFDDPALANALFTRLRDRLPGHLERDGARWELVGLNPRFRACRYRDGQAFAIHRDGPYVPTDDIRSYLTIQIYLDDAPDRVGGHTRFYADPRGEQRWASIAPCTGAAIVFDHSAWHDGEPVAHGVKHVLRTDAVYRRCSPAIARPDMIGRHRGYAWRAIACRDGQIASAGRDGVVHRWGARARAHALHAGSVTALVEDATGGLWCGTRSGAVFVLDGDTVQQVARDLGAVLAAALVKECIVLATSRGTLARFMARDLSQPAWTVAAHDGWAWAVTPLGPSIASCGADGRVAITGRDSRPRTFATLAAPLRAIAATTRGELVVGDTRGWLYHLGTDGACIATIRAHAAAITSIAIAPDGTWLSASEDGYIRRWRGTNRIAEVRSTDFVTSVACAPTGEVVCAGYDGAVWLARV